MEGFEGKERRKRDATPSPGLGVLIFSIRLKPLNLRGTEQMNWMRTLEGYQENVSPIVSRDIENK